MSIILIAHVFESVPKTNQIGEINQKQSLDAEAVACTASTDASIGAYTATRNTAIDNVV